MEQREIPQYLKNKWKINKLAKKTTSSLWKKPGDGVVS